MIFPSLNGWQRLWIVISMMMLIPIGFGAATFLPSEEDAINVVQAERRRRGSVDLFEMLALENLAKGIPIRETEAQLHENSTGPKVKLHEERLYEEIRNARLKNIATVIIVATLVWLATAAAVFGLGWAVAWVIRGFHGDDR